MNLDKILVIPFSFSFFGGELFDLFNNNG